MNVIQLNETSAIVNAITEMLMYKEVALYKSTKNYEIYKLKHTDIYICLVDTDVNFFSKQMHEIEFNTQVVKNLYQSENLNRDSLLQLYNLNVFM